MANIRLVQDSVLNENVRLNPTLLDLIPSRNYSVANLSGLHQNGSSSNASFASDAFTSPFVRGGMISHT